MFQLAEDIVSLPVFLFYFAFFLICNTVLVLNLVFKLEVNRVMVKPYAGIFKSHQDLNRAYSIKIALQSFVELYFYSGLKDFMNWSAFHKQSL